MSLKQRTKPKQAGYVLVLTLSILAALTILASTFAERASKQLQFADSRQRDVQAALAISNAKAEMLFRLATASMSSFGLGPTQELAVRLDDHAYLADADTAVQLQDARGLLDINRVTDTMLTQFMAQYVGKADEQARLIDTLRDYTDEDDFVRVSGAEAPQYKLAGLPAPRNKDLISPEELARVLVWRDLPGIKKSRELLDRLTTQGGFFNPNSMTRPVLLALPGMTAAGADAVIAHRELERFRTPDDFAATAQVPLEPLQFSLVFFPAKSIRMTFCGRGVSWRHRYNVTLSPSAEKAPWQIDYAFRIPAPVLGANDCFANNPLPLPKRPDAAIDLSSPLSTSP